MSKVNTTTRRFPRTLAEAFPDGPTYASSVEVYRKRISLDAFNFCLCVFALGFLCGAIFVKGMM